MATSPIAWSYARALTGPGSDSLGARSVEWLRDHHLGGAVTWVEQAWYDHHQPPTGGQPRSIGLPAIAEPNASVSAVTEQQSSGAVEHASGRAVPPVVATDNAATTQPGVLPPLLPMPAPLPSPAADTVSGEGQWSTLASVNGHAALLGTQIRPDAQHTSVLDLAVWIDPQLVRFQLFPGTNVPGSVPGTTPFVPSEQQSALVAAFNGGFRMGDARGGFYLAGQQANPLRDGAATLAITADGRPQIGVWGRDLRLTADLVAARQNLVLLVDNGKPTVRPDVPTGPEWGRTLRGSTLVWRSGIGVTGDGAFVWVGGAGLSVYTLADLLVRAGAVRGMEMDINHEWVQFNTYSTAADGSVSGTAVLPGSAHSGDRYLSTDTRDFVALFARPST